MADTTKTKDEVQTHQASVQRVGSYDSPSYDGEAYVHGLNFNNVESSWEVTSGHAFYEGKTGEWNQITGTSSGHGSYNYVYHQKQRWDAELVPVTSRHVSDYKGHTLTVQTVGLSSASTAKMLENIDRAATFGDSDANAELRATQGLKVGIQDASINLPTFLGELRDFKSVAQSVSGLLSPKQGKRAETRDAIKRALGFKPNSSFKDVVDLLVSADLIRKFAIEPLIGDLRSLSRLSAHVNRQIDRLQSSKPVAIQHTVTDTNDYYTYFGSPYSRHKHHVNVESRRTVIASKYVKFDMSEVKANEFLVGLDATGFDQFLQTGWELIPFSFVVDYFIGIGDFLSQFDGRIIDVPYETISEGRSVKIESTCTVETLFDRGIYQYLWSNDVKSSATGSLYKSQYWRKPGLPSVAVPALPQLRLPTVNQLGTIAELAYVLNT